MRWLLAHSNQLRLGGAGVEVRDEELVGRSTLRWVSRGSPLAR